MEWIKIVLPLVGVIIGWLLSESGKLLADKKQDKRKLKKILFFLLELRYHFSRELFVELDLDKFFETYKRKVAAKMGIDKNNPELNIDFELAKPLVSKALLKIVKNQEEKYKYLAENIEQMLIELAEVLPILAYDLSGRHNIKERLGRMNNYFSEIEDLTKEMPFDMKEWMNPKITRDILKDIDESLRKIAQKIDKETSNNVKDTIAKMNFNENDKDLEVFIGDFLKQMN